MTKQPRIVYLDDGRAQHQSIIICHACRKHETAEIPDKHDREDYLYCATCGSKDVTAFLDIDWEIAPRAVHSKKSWVVLNRRKK